MNLEQRELVRMMETYSPVGQRAREMDSEYCLMRVVPPGVRFDFAGTSETDQFDLGGGKRGADRLEDAIARKGVWDRGGEFDNQLTVDFCFCGGAEGSVLIFGSFFGYAFGPLMSLLE